jgi:hypothetical protein
MRFPNAGQHLDIANVELMASAYRAENGLAFSGGAVDLKSHADQALNHLLYLFFTRGFLHCNNHIFSEIPNPAQRVRDPYVLLSF